MSRDVEESILRLHEGRYGKEDERRDGIDRREPEPTNGSITWKGIRMPALLGLLLTVGGGTAYIKAKEPDAPELKARVLVLETDRDYIRRDLAEVKRAQAEMNGKLDTLLQNDARRAGREEAGRRR